MKHNIVILIALALCSVAVISAQNKTGTNKNDRLLIEQEKTAWKNLVDGKYDDFATMLADDYQGVYSFGTTTKASEMTNLKTAFFKSADVSDVKVQWVDKNTAIVTSTIKAEIGTTVSKPQSQTLRATSVVAKRGKQWLCVYHTDIKIEEMPPM